MGRLPASTSAFCGTSEEPIEFFRSHDQNRTVSIRMVLTGSIDGYSGSKGRSCSVRRTAVSPIRRVVTRSLDPLAPTHSVEPLRQAASRSSN